MIEFFKNIFKKKDNDLKSIVSFDVINSIYSHLDYQENNLRLKIKGISKIVSVDKYSFPESFDYDDSKKEFEKVGFKNSYEVLNELYKKVNIIGISEEDMIKELNYDYIHICFLTEPTPEIRMVLKSLIHNFIILFCCSDDSSEINDFRVLYNNSYFINYTKGLLDTKWVDVDHPEVEAEQIGFEKLNTVLRGICEYSNIELPKNLKFYSKQSVLQEEVSISHFIELLQLISRGEMVEEELQKRAVKLFENFRIEKDNNDYEDSFDFLDGINHWNSDWKFDAEEAEYIVTDLIKQDFKFEHPKKTYSQNLFAYIQTELAKQNLELMSFDTKGDSYLFFVVNKDEVKRILELAEITEIEIDKLY